MAIVRIIQMQGQLRQFVAIQFIHHENQHTLLRSLLRKLRNSDRCFARNGDRLLSQPCGLTGRHHAPAVAGHIEMIEDRWNAVGCFRTAGIRLLKGQTDVQCKVLLPGRRLNAFKDVHEVRLSDG